MSKESAIRFLRELGTKAASSDIAELEDEDVEDVAGGRGHPIEWCWSDYWCVMAYEISCGGIGWEVPCDGSA